MNSTFHEPLSVVFTCCCTARCLHMLQAFVLHHRYWDAAAGTSTTTATPCRESSHCCILWPNKCNALNNRSCRRRYNHCWHWPRSRSCTGRLIARTAQQPSITSGTRYVHVCILGPPYDTCHRLRWKKTQLIAQTDRQPSTTMQGFCVLKQLLSKKRLVC